ncbi:hypothetical protein UCRPA7_6943 [Phaeoacremonium minimum UCRPA7]|uniref:Uncharacterized protein n=1 Tax=Phaeoacremonium minimum (strain UCR-PA7) TaxID=1286976 RepID=R8BEC8_PHAM7|nr:hypothetical protein UCRPA7_6943 [Phaeoacremonium minimum UCRPA7]EON97647.1 hypothetical protein UCRPA7_6943 [Phaeoacremonium minimum UCRPA7]
MSLGQLTSSEFLSCTPYPETVTRTATTTETFTTTYCVTYPAACPTSEWLATYTVVEVCTGNPATWVTPGVPPNFAVTTVTCDVCEHQTQTITAPVVPAAATGTVTVNGNGVTITPAATTGVVVATSPPGGGVVTAGAPSLKRSLGLMAGVALALGQFML